MPDGQGQLLPKSRVAGDQRDVIPKVSPFCFLPLNRDGGGVGAASAPEAPLRRCRLVILLSDQRAADRSGLVG